MGGGDQLRQGGKMQKSSSVISTDIQELSNKCVNQIFEARSKLKIKKTISFHRHE
jgi:hypothetical protein